MCLFLTALLRDGRISLDEYGIEIRGFCVNFLWVVEAAAVLAWKTWLMVVVSANLVELTRSTGRLSRGWTMISGVCMRIRITVSSRSARG
jgi:hypothetical protein